MAETTEERCAFAFVVLDFQNWDTRLYHVVNTRLWRHPPRAGIPPAVESPGGGVGVGEGTSVCRFKSVPTWWLLGLICAVPERSAMQGGLSPARVFVLLSCVSGEIYLRLKPYLVVKISFDIVTEHCCQVCILSMMFCCSDCQLWACGGKWLRNQETPRSIT